MEISKQFETDTLEELTTLKSSTVKPVNEKFEKGKKPAIRVKVIQNAIELLKRGILINDVVYTVNTIFEEDHEVWITLFKKQQHGPVREILVMTLEARLMQLMTEKISRGIDKCLKTEVLTDGSRKMDFVKRHHQNLSDALSKNRKFKKVLNSNDLLDCTTWCQRFVMNIFICAMKNFCPPYLFPYMVAVMNKFGKKKIVFPETLLNEFKEKPGMNYTFESIKEARKFFLGEEVDDSFISKESIFFVNKSNMGQGIHHYNSSLVGTILDDLHEFMWERYFSVISSRAITMFNKDLIQSSLAERQMLSKRGLFGEYIAM